MTLARPDVSVEPGPEDNGHPTLRVSSRALWLDVLADAGPRIIRLGVAGSTDNLLAETPDVGWDTVNGRYQLFGGHRLWFAPEDPDRVAFPDLDGVTVERTPDGVRLVGRLEPPTFLVRSIEIRLHPDLAALQVRHELHNRGDEVLMLAPWSITQLPLGGTVLLPHAPAAAGHHVRPNRNLVLWPYSSWMDPRLTISDDGIALEGAAGADLKVGCRNELGWIAYVRAGTAVVQRFERPTMEPYPDLECNVEAYCGPRYVELEILGPLRALLPGETSVLVEHWEVRSDLGAVVDPHGLAALLGQPMRAPGTGWFGVS